MLELGLGLPWSVTQNGASVTIWVGESLMKVLLVGWLIAESEEAWWQSVLGSWIQVFLLGDIR
jgi:hypothetical protein